MRVSIAHEAHRPLSEFLPLDHLSHLESIMHQVLLVQAADHLRGEGSFQIKPVGVQAGREIVWGAL